VLEASSLQTGAVSKLALLIPSSLPTHVFPVILTVLLALAAVLISVAAALRIGQFSLAGVAWQHVPNLNSLTELLPLAKLVIRAVQVARELVQATALLAQMQIRFCGRVHVRLPAVQTIQLLSLAWVPASLISSLCHMAHKRAHFPPSPR
jgi:hypothetical protein